MKSCFLKSQQLQGVPKKIAIWSFFGEKFSNFLKNFHQKLPDGGFLITLYEMVIYQLTNFANALWMLLPLIDDF